MTKEFKEKTVEVIAILKDRYAMLDSIKEDDHFKVSVNKVLGDIGAELVNLKMFVETIKDMPDVLETTIPLVQAVYKLGNRMNNINRIMTINSINDYVHSAKQNTAYGKEDVKASNEFNAQPEQHAVDQDAKNEAVRKTLAKNVIDNIIAFIDITNSMSDAELKEHYSKNPNTIVEFIKGIRVIVDDSKDDDKEMLKQCKAVIMSLFALDDRLSNISRDEIVHAIAKRIDKHKVDSLDPTCRTKTEEVHTFNYLDDKGDIQTITGTKKFIADYINKNL